MTENMSTLRNLSYFSDTVVSYRLIITASIALNLPGCCAPDKCEQAITGKDEAKPVIAALQTYLTAHNKYPEVLHELTPSYLSSDHTVLDDSYRTLEYERSSDGFKLKFEYTGPGINSCVYQSSNNQWSCTGHF